MMKKLWTVCYTLAFLTVGVQAHAVPEKTLESAFDAVIVPTIEQNSYIDTFTGVDDVPITYMVVDPILEPGQEPAGALVILNGRTESLYTYYEFIYDLRHLGLTIYTMDHRGQGASGRMIEDGHRGYVKHFGHYVDDVKTLVDTVVMADGHEKIFMHGQSMGGAVATIYAERYPNDLTGLVLTSPMVQMNTDPYPEFAAYGLVTFNALTGKGSEYAPGQGPFDPTTWTLEECGVTSSYIRWKLERDWLVDNEKKILGGATNKWIKEALEGTLEARGRAWEIKTPVLMLQASEDHHVKLGGQDKVCSRAKNCEKVVVEGALHELPIEADFFRDQAMTAIESFLLERL